MRHRIPGALGLGGIMAMTVLLAAAGTVLAVDELEPVPTLPPPTPIVTSPNDTPTPAPTITQNPCEIIILQFDAVVTADPSASSCPTRNPCASPVILELLAVVTAEPDSAPTVTAPVCSTPFESFAGETGDPNGTPPPTSAASDAGTGQTPIFALLIAALFGGLGLALARLQRRSLRHH